MPISREHQITDTRTPRATDLSSIRLKERWSRRLREESTFSARTTELRYAERLKKTLSDIVAGRLTAISAETRLRRDLASLGYSPKTGFGTHQNIPPAAEGSIQDLASSVRIQLILDTNVKKARSLAQLEASKDPAYLLSAPAWRLTRTGARKKPRGDWKQRWKAAGESVGWRGAVKGEFVALKDSPIWEALGNGAGGFSDTLGSPYPPYAFGSGLGWVDVPVSEWRRVCARHGVAVEMPTVAGVSREGAKADAPSDAPALKGRVAELEAALREWEEADGAAVERERREEDESGAFPPLNLPPHAKKGFNQRKAEEAVEEALKTLRRHLGRVKSLVSRDVRSCKAVLDAAGGGAKDLLGAWKALDARVRAATDGWEEGIAAAEADRRLLAGIGTPSEKTEAVCGEILARAVEASGKSHTDYRAILVLRGDIKNLEQEARKRRIVAIVSERGASRKDLDRSVRSLFRGYRRQPLNPARVRPEGVGAAVRAVSRANDGFGRIISARNDIMEAVNKSARSENAKVEIREAVRGHSMSAMRNFLTERSRGRVSRSERIAPDIPRSHRSAIMGRISKGVDFVASVASKRCVDGKRVNVVVSKTTDDSRAKYSPAANLLIATADTKPAVFAHELGHWLAEHNPHIAELCQAFLKHRIGDERPESLTALSGGKGYKPDEMACKDHFVNPYMGKIYPEPIAGHQPMNEILSMGLQYICEDLTTPLEDLKRPPLYLADREYFDFIVSVIKGEV